jgi:tRNA threonylcarbamoyladenosine dehydratase
MGLVEPVVVAALRPEPPAADADLERRFGGLRRLYGDVGYGRLRRAQVVVVGLGGVGSWTVEALARSGVAALTLIDLDHVSESNINRQVQALTSTLGMGKAAALQSRIREIHPGCRVQVVDAFVEEGQWPGLLGQGWGAAPDVLIDACDDARAKRLLADWALDTQSVLVMVGAAGGKRQPQAVDLADLSEVTHDPLLARLRQHLRRSRGWRPGQRMGLPCVFSREAVVQPPVAADDACAVDGSLNCHGYGSSVTVTASFGLAAAAAAIEHIVRHPRKHEPGTPQ